MNEQLIMLLVFGAIAAFSTWINKRRQEREAREQETPPPPRPASGAPAPRRPVSWEEEMRRLLEGTSPAPTPSAPAPKPQPSFPPSSRQVPPPIIVGTPAPVRTSRPAPSPAASLDRTQRQREEARKRKTHAEEQLRAVMLQSEAGEPAAPVAWDGLRQQLSDRDSLRSAFVVSLIFGPPKALGDQ